MTMTLLEKLKLKAFDPKTQIEMTQWTQTLEKLAPAKLEDIQEFENIIGFPLPLSIKELYTEIGNGYFGPGYGFLPLCAANNKEENILSLNGDFNYIFENSPVWKPSFIHLVHWGCGIYSCMDLAQPEDNIFVFDDNSVLDDDNGAQTTTEALGIFKTSRNLDQFLEAWANDIKIWDEMFHDMYGDE